MIGWWLEETMAEVGCGDRQCTKGLVLIQEQKGSDLVVSMVAHG